MKGEMEFGTVEMMALLFFLAVFMVLVLPNIRDVFTEAGSKSECNWNLLLASLVGKIPFAQIPVGCKAEYYTLDADAIKRQERLAKQRILDYHKLQRQDTESAPRSAISEDKPQLKAPENSRSLVGAAYQGVQSFSLSQNLQQTFPLSGTQPTPDAIREWSLDAIMAKKAVDCWDKVWRAKISFWGDDVSTKNYCIVCSVVSFSDDLPATLQNRKITSLPIWMKSETYYGKSYYDNLVDGSTIPPIDSQLTFSTDKPVAVMYYHVKKSWLEKNFRLVFAVGVAALPPPVDLMSLLVIADEATGTPLAQDTHAIYIAPLEKLALAVRTDGTGGFGCTELIM